MLPGLEDVSITLLYFRGYKSHDLRYWRCESFITQLTLLGAFFVIIFGLQTMAQLDPTDAFMASSIAKDQICVNITCGGHYCQFTQPLACGQTPIHMKKNEVEEFCTPRENCNWDVEILSDSGYDNRSVSLYIENNGELTYFPQLENLKRIYVSITKYINTQTGLTIVDWDISSQTLSKKMEKCSYTGNVNPDNRCGSYNIYFANTIYESAVTQRYATELSIIGGWVFSVCVAMVITFNGALNIYRTTNNYKHEFSGKID
jgi:hypothetical protein